MSKSLVWTRSLLLPLLLLLSASPCDSARILGLLSTPSRSHHIFNRALMLELAARGHYVTVFSPDPEDRPVPNHRDVVLDGVYEEEYDYEVVPHLSYSQEVVEFFEWGLATCDKILKSDGARQLMKLTENETFDLIIAEVMVQECLLPFVSKFGNPPIVGITAYGIPPWANDLVGNYQNPSFVNTFNLPYSYHMTFLQRLTNFLLDMFVRYYRNYVYMPKQDRISRQFFGESVPLPSEIEKNISLVLVNAYLGTHYPQPHVPAVVPVGGMQIRPPQPLPKDLQDYLDSAPQGVIYMCLGTNVRSDKLGENQLRAFLEAFQELPQKVLWKWESDSLPGQPANVKIIKWAPQNDILAHPNVKAFVSHGGMLSTSEAVQHGVPVVGVPFFADQYVNLRRVVARGGALQLDSLNLTRESVLKALTQVLIDPSYRDRMKRLSAIYRDRPQTALETAVWWTEYALRHQGAPHLRCASLDLHWFQRWLLDVIAFLLLAAVSGYTAAYLIVRRLLSALQAKGRKLKTT
ncbi:UDP-glycosyltransferase UGT5-like [Schistocerca cancellata]|uniref:UDP-glycosyltransferase UGT5-like n=1 Tax=Schistocerca cancellata TaxID=274614 RepID=UPI00211843C3|nr:UDP-glycosyltransferase UGT5-like [Schistocerca cancellata]